jgi:hypothetical protein
MIEILPSETQFIQSYRQRLLDLLKHGENDSDGGLADFILACANVYLNKEMLKVLVVSLNSSFLRLQSRYHGLLAKGRLTKRFLLYYI